MRRLLDSTSVIRPGLDGIFQLWMQCIVFSMCGVLYIKRHRSLHCCDFCASTDRRTMIYVCVQDFHPLQQVPPVGRGVPRVGRVLPRRGRVPIPDRARDSAPVRGRARAPGLHPHGAVSHASARARLRRASLQRHQQHAHDQQQPQVGSGSFLKTLRNTTRARQSCLHERRFTSGWNHTFECRVTAETSVFCDESACRVLGKVKQVFCRQSVT